MSPSDPTHDPYLTQALDGVHLIQASAGTGKTYTLATLFTRLIVEHDLRMAQILAVTYTEAATQELRKRIRERLALAARLANTPTDQDGGPEHTHSEQAGPEHALTRHILQRHLEHSHEPPARLARRLRLAAEEADLAAIFTIHGFCARVLRDHALLTGQGLEAAQRLDAGHDLYAEVAADLWRVHATTAESARALAYLWKTPDALAADLPTLCLDLPLLPPAPPELAPAFPPDLDAACQRLAEGIIAHGTAYFSDLLAALDADILNKVTYKADWLRTVQDQLMHWSRQPDPAVELDPRISHLDYAALAAKTKKAHTGKTPVSPLQPLIADYLQVREHEAHWQRQQAISLLHRLRTQARQRLQQLKHRRRVHTYDDLIQGVANALQGPHAQALVARLRHHYRVALVDEFQDTDPRQWQIFATVFADSDPVRDAGQPPALFLIGDPKQAIYGFRGGDVETYLLARRMAQPAPPLDHNFRARPAVLRALHAMYENAQQAGQDAFAHPDIRFEPVQPGGRRNDHDYLCDDQPAPALTLRLLRMADNTPVTADSSRQAAAAACVADIHRVLTHAQAGRAHVQQRHIHPGDVAVLVRNHSEATRMQHALARAGIAAVAAGRQSLFETDQANELRTLLLALLQPADTGRLRAALATVLLGQHATDLAALDTDGPTAQTWQTRLLHWRERLHQHGPFALISQLCAEQAERLLGLTDGERRMTNYLQLGEYLQEACARTLGLRGLLDDLQARIANADPNDETQLLRLESDAQRVQIITLHKSKGLQYPLVYLPFVGIGSVRPDNARYRIVHDGQQRVLHWKIDKHDPAWKHAGEQTQQQARAEEARLLYVGLTRAEQALWIAAGDLAQAGHSRLAPLLADLNRLQQHPDIRLVEGPAEPPPPRLPSHTTTAPAPARTVQRRFAADWWVYSFTQLAHSPSGADPLASAIGPDYGGQDEPPAADPHADPAPANLPTALPTPAADPRFVGSRFGVVMHAALENTDFAAWRDWQPGQPAPADQHTVISHALSQAGYAHSDIDDGLDILVPLIGHCLGTVLPEGGRLADLPATARRAEMEFHFALAATPVSALLALLHRHGVLRTRTRLGIRQHLQGLMTGLIDLTYCKDGRWYVLDYKSNQLPGYDHAAMQQAMAHSQYDLQAVIYTLALHRWLRFRLGRDYDYRRDFGGVRYLFCRGMDLTRTPSPGVYAQRVDADLVDALDALLSGHTSGGAPA